MASEDTSSTNPDDKDDDEYVTEKTEVIYGAENVFDRAMQGIPLAKETMDLCGERDGSSTIVANKPILDRYIEASKRGVKIRQITEITKKNVLDCKRLMDCMELRHLDGLHGYFVVVDGKEFYSHAYGQERKSFPHMVASTVKVFVLQQQYFFNTLWEKAIPAEQRIREIEEGRTPEKLEIIHDTYESISRAFDIMKKTQKELLVLFATPRTFKIALQADAGDMYRKMSENGVDIKVLVPRGDAEIEENNEQIAKLREEISPSIDLRLSDAGLNTRMTIMISDRNEFMSWELRDDTLNDPYLAGGIATYSNIKSLANSYATIFDNLWKITELVENLRIANIKLEGSEKAMKEFINIAAHELRTPLQPILGLSGMLHSARSDPQKHSKFVEIIVRNALKLENVAENILDVTRIESGRLQLSMKELDLHELVETVVSDFQAGNENEFDEDETEKASKPVICIKDEYPSDRGPDPNREHPIVLADTNRIVQVITNLLSNAVKFSPEWDRMLITVTRGIRLIDGKPMAIVSISDQGRGVNPEIVPRLFQKFISGSEKGTGLGLYISKNIVKAHGGEIWAESNKSGKGATFAFSLPVLKS